MKKILKIGDKVYAQSLQNFSQSYVSGFPQREQFLAQHCTDISFSFFRHAVICSIDDVIRERQRLQKYLRTRRFDLLMVDNPLSGLLIEETCKISLLFDSIDWYNEMYLKEYGINATYYLLQYGLSYLLEKANKVVSQSPVNLKMLQQSGLKTKDVIVIPNGYDKTLFYPYSQPDVVALKKDFSSTFHTDLLNKKIVVYTGKLGRFYEHIKLIARAIPDNYIFLIVGDGPVKREIPKRKNVILCGAVSYADVPKYTNIADVLVFPVETDCSPIAISEYLAVGKPIVMGTGRIDWLLKNGKTGYLVASTVDAWRKGIERAVLLDAACRIYNTNLVKDLSWQTLAKKLTDFVNK